MPGTSEVKCLKKALRKVETKGMAAHVGVAYYLRHTNNKPYVVDQNKDEFKTTITCSGTFMKIVAPNSTLA